MELELVAAEIYFEGAFDDNVLHVKATCGDDVTPVKASEPTGQLPMQLHRTRVVGPLGDPESFVRPQGCTDFLEDLPLETGETKRASAERVLRRLASRAFRRPVSKTALRRLIDFAESVWDAEGGSFELGISQAAVAVLSSPSFLFKETFAEPSDERFPLVDQHSLATKMSYFLWSTMPDERLLTLADCGELRERIDAEVERMITDDRLRQWQRRWKSTHPHQFTGVVGRQRWRFDQFGPLG